MSLQIRSLASGSSGNAFLVRTATSTLLIDAGLSARALERHLRHHDVDPAALSAIVLSHEHHDHAQGAGPLARRYNVPIVCTAGTAQALGAAIAGVEVRTLSDAGVTVGDTDLWSFPVPHDAADPCGILLRHNQWTIGVALDLGHAPSHVAEALQAADLVVIEANHDRERLLATAYPWSTKHRILSDRGHLSNLQAAQVLATIAEDGRHRDVWLAHLSEKGNDQPQQVIKFIRHYLSMVGAPRLDFAVALRNTPSAVWHGQPVIQQHSLLPLD